jgi:hypothetical protein
MRTTIILAALLWAAGVAAAPTQPSADSIAPVTVNNFIRAESDMYFSAIVVRDQGFGKSITLGNWLRLMIRRSSARIATRSTPRPFSIWTQAR